MISKIFKLKYIEPTSDSPTKLELIKDSKKFLEIDISQTTELNKDLLDDLEFNPILFFLDYQKDKTNFLHNYINGLKQEKSKKDNIVNHPIIASDLDEYHEIVDFVYKIAKDRWDYDKDSEYPDGFPLVYLFVDKKEFVNFLFPFPQFMSDKDVDLYNFMDAKSDYMEYKKRKFNSIYKKLDYIFNVGAGLNIQVVFYSKDTVTQHRVS